MFNFGRKDFPLPNNVIIIVNNAAKNTGVDVSLQISDFFFPDIFPGVELMGQVIVLFLVFKLYFIYSCSFGCAGSVAVRGLSLVVASRDYSSM